MRDLHVEARLLPALFVRAVQLLVVLLHGPGVALSTVEVRSSPSGPREAARSVRVDRRLPRHPCTAPPRSRVWPRTWTSGNGKTPRTSRAVSASTSSPATGSASFGLAS